MSSLEFFKRLRRTPLWAREALAALIFAGAGFAIMPLLVFFAGSSALGRYDGASPAGLYDSLYGGLGASSAVSWIVLFGPYALYLTFKALRRWWRASARLASSD